MKPIYLEMENIGPFVKRTRIDFTDIEEDGLFLISGPTGAGKSFIFDTICYALYGATPSGREGNLASDHAGLGDEPRIEFGFEIGENTYIAERTLEHTAEKRGGGKTTRPEKASLVRIEKGRENLDGYRREVAASGKSNVKKRSTEIMGLEMEQFSRVMMIPQGEFRELLKADTEKREGLLRRLFDSFGFVRIAMEFESRTKSLRKEIGERHTRTETVIDSMVDNLSLEGGPGEGTTFEDWSEKVLEDLSGKSIDISVREKEAHKVWESSLKELEIAREIFKLETDLGISRKKIEELKRIEKDEIKSERRKLELHDKVSRFAPDLQSLRELAIEKERANSEKEKLTGTLKELQGRIKDTEERIEKESPLIAGKLEKIGVRSMELGGILPELKDLRVSMKSLDDKRKELNKTRSTIDKVKSETNSLENKMEDLRKESKTLPSPEDTVKLDRVVKAGKDLMSILEKLEVSQGKLESVSKSFENAENRLKEAESDLDSIRKRREDSIAGELARDLASGERCPVCGSTDHPSPRKPSREDVSMEDVRRSETTLKNARSEMEKILKFKTGLEAESEGFRRRKEEIISEYGIFSGSQIGEMERIVRDHNERRMLSERSRKREKEINRQLEEMEKELKKLREKSEQFHAPIKEMERQATHLESLIEMSSKRAFDLGLDPARDDLVLHVEGLLKKLAVKKGELERKREEDRKNLLKMEKELERTDQSLKISSEISKRTAGKIMIIQGSIEKKLKELKDPDLGTVDDLVKNLLEERIEKKLKGKVEIHQKEKVETDSLIHRLLKRREELGKGIDVRTEEDLQPYIKAESEMKASWKEAGRMKATIEKDHITTKKQIDNITKVKDEIKDREKELRIVGRLSDQVRGLGHPRMSLERFFLAQRFEEVLIASNQRLKILSGNRFLLSRADETERGGRSKVGLDLNVYDNYTGQERPANTLSGGQMFLSSLALALGLADVVQSRSGGIRMDALFIDEGFGSLDEETLQTALKVLSELRQGRMVGVISHVGELKRQIRTGFEVVPSPSGSRLRTLG